jgi:hypothetical protein
VNDEYGPSIYRHSVTGRFLGALPVAASVRPLRNGVTDYSSNNPTVGQPAPSPANPSAGRANIQGFEGLPLSPDGKTLFVARQNMPHAKTSAPPQRPGAATRGCSPATSATWTRSH